MAEDTRNPRNKPGGQFVGRDPDKPKRGGGGQGGGGTRGGNRDKERPGYGGNKEGGQGGAKGDQNGVPDFFEARLDELGLRLTKDGRIVAEGAGKQQLSVEQLRVIQQGYNRFGLTNDFYDPNRVAFAGEMTQTGAGKAPVFYDLSTGRATSGSGVADDELLERLRTKTGWTPEQAYAYLQENDRLASYGQAGSTFEGWMGYEAAARQNYLNPPPTEAPAPTQTTPTAGSFLGGFDVTPDEVVGVMGDAVSQMLANRRNQNVQGLAQQPFFDIQDLAGAEE